jgi:hypothetical protein
MVEMNYVESSNVEQVGYDVDAMELHVKFKNSEFMYVYLEVPQGIYDGLLVADSVGSYLNREVKSIYKFERR